MDEQLKCEQCDKAGDVYTMLHYNDYGIQDDETVFVLCSEHATQTGFCPSCSDFVAGSESHDDMLRRYGYCVDCNDELNADYEYLLND